MLYNVNKYLTTNTFKYFYYLLFKYLHLNGGNPVRSQNIITIKRLTIFQKKTLRKINFEPRDFHSSALFSILNILKLLHKTILEKCILISKAINNF